MSKEEHHQRRDVQLAGDRDAALAEMQQRVAAAGGRVTEPVGDVLEAKFGNQALFRIVGGFFCPTRWFPVKATVGFAPSGDGTTTATVQVDEAMGIGTKAGMTKKYGTAVSDVVFALTKKP